MLVLALVAPWFAAIAVKSGGAFYGEAVGHDMLGNLEIEQGELAQARDSLKRAWDITPASISRCVNSFGCDVV